MPKKRKEIADEHDADHATQDPFPHETSGRKGHSVQDPLQDTTEEAHHSDHEMAAAFGEPTAPPEHDVHLVVESNPGDSDTTKDLPIGYQSWDEVHQRSSRFPTIDERVRLYMSNWYAPPCESEHSESFVRYHTEHGDNTVEVMVFQETRTEKEKKRGPLRIFTINATVGFDELHYTDTHIAAFQDCSNAYCRDMVKYLFPSIPEDEGHLPLLFQFSDAEKTRAYSDTKGRTVAYPNTPLFKKFRYALSRSELDKVTAPCTQLPRPIPQTVVQQHASGSQDQTIMTSQPIVFKLKTQRHYGYIDSVPAADRPWSKKKNQAIFRGQFTGKLPPNHGATTFKEQCMLLSRCQLVYSSASSPLVDAKLALPVLEAKKDFPKVLDNVELYGDRFSLQDMLAYKAIIMLEGNDVSSGLKWALYSNSVVMAPSPTKTSWAMEEYLVPWRHYIPLADDLSNVEEMMQWVIDNDEKAQEIANHGRLWISDLVYHPDAERDEEQIFHEIYGRYKVHFAKDEKVATLPDKHILGEEK